MDIPAPFQSTIQALQGDKLLEKAYWSSDLKRHYIVEMRQPGTSQRYVCKLAESRKIDKDDLYPHHNFRRPFWAWGILQFWKQHTEQPLPFIIPRPGTTNAYEANPGPVLWMMMDYLPHQPICAELPPRDNTGSSLNGHFSQLCHAMAASHHAMQQITLASVQEFMRDKQLPDFLPHQSLGVTPLLLIKMMKKVPLMRYLTSWIVRGIERTKRRHVLRHPDEYMFDIGAFERKNVLRPPLDAEPGVICTLSDVEFATWSLPHTALAKAYIRLWANDQRPDLARQLLRTYLDKYQPAGEQRQQFFPAFAQRLLPKTYSGTFFDYVDRGIRDRFDLSRILRRELRRMLMDKAWYELIRED